MSAETTKDSLFKIKKLSQSNDYYNNVFKKTERLVSVTFYVVSFLERTPQSQVHIEAISARALHLYETALASLTWGDFEAGERLFGLQHALVALQGALTIAQGGRVLTAELYQVLLEPIDATVRYLHNHYLEKSAEGEGVTVAESERSVRPPRSAPLRPSAPRARERVMIPKGDISSDAHLVYSQLTDRSERIKTVLEAKPEATIKDIAEIITDVSEKTIQRELNSLIEKGQVIRQGERRWSKYSLASAT